MLKLTLGNWQMVFSHAVIIEKKHQLTTIFGGGGGLIRLGGCADDVQ